MPSVEHGRFFFRSRAEAWTMLIPRPARRAISRPLRASTLIVPQPTVPRPRMPILTGFIFVRLWEPQMNADKRRLKRQQILFLVFYPRSSAFICGFAVWLLTF